MIKFSSEFIRSRVKGSNPPKWKACTEKEACKLIKEDPKVARLKWAYPNNWTQKYNLYCDKADTRDADKSIVLIMNTILCLVLLALADKLGRKKVLLISGTLILLGMNINVLSPSLRFKMVGMGLAAGAEGTFSGLFSIMINETTGKVSEFDSDFNFEFSEDNQNEVEFNFRVFPGLWIRQYFY